jgi:hypothetical protein
MKLNFIKSILLLVLLGIGMYMNSCKKVQSSEQKKELKSGLSEQTYKPWAYWWWMGSSVTKEGITKNLEAYQKAGMGGMHIIPIYGEKGDEENFIEYLSPQWMEMLAHTVSEADRLGMGIDMTTGTGWPFGGPNLTYKNSAKRFELKEINLQETKNINNILQTYKEANLIHLSAQTQNGKYTDITKHINKNGEIEGASAFKKGWALIMCPTRQKVKRAAPGGEGLVLDYFNKEALNKYFDGFQQAFDSTTFPSGKVRSFYNDSYEVYGANFTGNFLGKFEEKKSYKFTDYLHVIADPNTSETKERIVSDFNEVISDLLYSEFTIPWVKRSHELGMLTRNQAHGSPGNILDLYGAADIPETESFGVSDFSIPGLKQDPDFEEERFGRPSPFTMKFASSAAHIKGKKLVASETATWLGDHFKVALSQVKPQIDELFTAGINHIVYHGITYNPPEKPFPGRLFYASTNFGTRSHFWNELPALNKYIERCQEVLQNSKPYNDILVYFPIHDIWAKKYTDELILKLEVHHSDNWLKQSNFGEIVSSLWDKGYTFDYVSDKMLADANVQQNEVYFNNTKYKTILVPECEYMPEETLEQLKKLAENGAKVIFQNRLPETVSGFSNLKQRKSRFSELKKQIVPLVAVNTNVFMELKSTGIVNESMASQGLSFIRKKTDSETIYFITNLADKFYTELISLATQNKNILRYDPLTGETGRIQSKTKNGKTEIHLNLEPGQSCILRCSNEEYDAQEWFDHTVVNRPVKLGNEWKLSALNSNSQEPLSLKTKEFKSWPEYGGEWETYSGKVLYSGEFNLDGEFVGKEMLLDLKDARETARVKINGEEIGLLWCIPFITIVPKDILKEKNKIEIEVTNLSFNKVIELDRQGVQWKNFHEINFVNIGYKPYDASDKEPVESGLLSEIKLYPIK